MTRLETLKRNFLRHNVSNTDRSIRILLAVCMVVLYLSHVVGGVLAVMLLVRGALFLATGILAFCPVYWLFNINTRLARQKALA